MRIVCVRTEYFNAAGDQRLQLWTYEHFEVWIFWVQMLGLCHMILGIDAHFLNSTKTKAKNHSEIIHNIPRLRINSDIHLVGSNNDRESFIRILICSKQSMKAIQFRSHLTLPYSPSPRASRTDRNAPE